MILKEDQPNEIKPAKCTDNKLSEEKVASEDAEAKPNDSAMKKEATKKAAQKKIAKIVTNDGTTEKIEIKNEDIKAVSTEKSKAELKAERRAVQEAQRAAKLAAQNEKTKQHNEKAKPPKTEVNKEQIKLKKVISIQTIETITSVPGTIAHKKLQLFHHLDYQHKSFLSKELSYNLHSSIIRLGIQYMSHTILGSNARCLALLAAIKQLVEDYHAPQNEEFCRSLESNLQLSTNYLQKCRPMAVSMTNALRHIKLHLMQIPSQLSDEEKKEMLIEGINMYINDDLEKADMAISMSVNKKICNGDVILVYGW